VVRVAAEQLADAVELDVGQTERPVHVFGDPRQGSESTREGRRPGPR
jgi:hypothetical protein